MQDNVASTPLHVAAGEGHLEAIAALVSLVSRAFQARRARNRFANLLVSSVLL